MFAARCPAFEQVFAKGAGDGEAAHGGKRSFVDLVEQGGELRKLAARELERIQPSGRALEEADTWRFEACVSPMNEHGPAWSVGLLSVRRRRDRRPRPGALS